VVKEFIMEVNLTSPGALGLSNLKNLYPTFLLEILIVYMKNQNGKV
jgi:hypothetical protein